MTEPPFIPFYIPYGMSDEEYKYELQKHQEAYNRWCEEQYLIEQGYYD